MMAGTRSPSASNGRLVVAWLAVAAPLSWGIAATVREAAALRLSNKLELTILPLLLGIAVCVFFLHFDRTRFTIRGVVGPYFAAVAVLFALFASLLAAEVWQRQTKEDLLFRLEINGMNSLLQISASATSDASAVREAVRRYVQQPAPDAAAEEGSADADRAPREALQQLYRLAADPGIFKGSAVANAAFLHSLDVVQSAREDRSELHKAHVAPSKFFMLMLFGFLTQIAIAFCHAGNPRALAASVMLFSVAFSAATGILALLDDPYERVPTVSTTLLSAL